jgi:hypothetical protein
MKTILPFLMLLSLILYSCASSRLSPADIKSKSDQQFEDLFLTVGHEVNDLRLDIIRQTTDCVDSDGVVTSQEVAYHPMGLYLGNGLFFDLNNNLSIRIDSLYAIGEMEDYEIVKTGNINRKTRVVYSRNQNEICYRRVRNENDLFKFCLSEEEAEGSLELQRRGKRRYKIMREEDNVCFYRRKDTRAQCIRTLPSGEGFVHKGRGRTDTYIQKQNELILDNRYRVALNAAKDEITIYRVRKRTDQLLWTVKKGEGKLLIYNNRMIGRTLEQNRDLIMVYRPGFRNVMAYRRVD